MITLVQSHIVQTGVQYKLNGEREKYNTNIYLGDFRKHIRISGKFWLSIIYFHRPSHKNKHQDYCNNVCIF